MLTRRQFSSLVVSASAGAVPSVFGAADAFPSRPIELIVGYGAGGAGGVIKGGETRVFVVDLLSLG